MGNFNCYHQCENDKMQIKNHNSCDYINIENEENFIYDSIVPISFLNNKADEEDNKINKIKNEIKSNNQKNIQLKYSNSFDNELINEKKISNPAKPNDSKIIKLTRYKSFPEFHFSHIINRSLNNNKKNNLQFSKDLSLIEHSKTQILKIITINNFFPQNNTISIHNIRKNSKNKLKNISKSKLNKERLKNISAKKIQRKYRSIKNRLNYQKNIRPKLIKESNAYIQHLLNLCSQKIPKKFFPRIFEQAEEEYSLINYQKFYKKNDPFFLYNYGKVFHNQIRVEKTSPENFSVYQGEMNLDNQKHGFGKLTTKKYTLLGTWRKNKFTGWCRETNNKGNYLEAKFINGFANGKGILGDKKGNKYTGDFVNSVRCGKGELITDKFHYIGDFVNNMMEGYGKIKFLKEGHEYEGQFKKNQIEGWGVFFWKNGDKYEGQMKNGKLNGKGKYYYNNGNIFEGIFVNGMKK